MSLVILGGEDLDTLAGWSSDHFADVPSGKGPSPDFSAAGMPFQARPDRPPPSCVCNLLYSSTYRVGFVITRSMVRVSTLTLPFLPKVLATLYLQPHGLSLEWGRRELNKFIYLFIIYLHMLMTFLGQRSVCVLRFSLVTLPCARYIASTCRVCPYAS